MIKPIDPGPVERADGGIDYKMDTCAETCYWRDKDGVFVGQCPLLKVGVYGLFCHGDNDC